MHIGDTMKKISRSAILFLTFIILIIAFASTTIYMVRAENKTEKNIVVYLDPGHGGADPGGGSNKYWKEKNLALKISKYQNMRLNSLNIPSVLTRDNDTYTLKAVDINGNIIDTVSTSLKDVIKAKENQK